MNSGSPYISQKTSGIFFHLDHRSSFNHSTIFVQELPYCSSVRCLFHYSQKFSQTVQLFHKLPTTEKITGIFTYILLSRSPVTISLALDSHVRNNLCFFKFRNSKLPSGSHNVELMHSVNLTTVCAHFLTNLNFLCDFAISNGSQHHRFEAFLENARRKLKASAERMVAGNMENKLKKKN